MDENLLSVIAVGEKLDAIGCRWLLVGSLASSVRGVPRGTLDADIVADLRLAQVKPLIQSLGDDWYFDEQSIRDALAQRSSFNLIDMNSGLKLDVFLPKLRHFDGGQFTRALRTTVSKESAAMIPVCAAEDIVVAKLEWFRMGNEVSDRQWSDIIGVLKGSAEKLDLELLKVSATELGVSDLLVKAMAEAGVA